MSAHRDDDQLPMYLTPGEAGALLRTLRKVIYVMHERGQLPGAIKVRRRLLIRRQSLLDWLDQQCASSLQENGPHRLRHTFCSHLAMNGASVLEIKELAGHANLSTTQRYMHLTPAVLDGAIARLERHRAHSRGEIGESVDELLVNSSSVNT
jgi:site-specific recombinase XerC